MATLAVLATVFDALILLWLVGTWFYEGHHKRCEVKFTCPNCQREAAARCEAGRTHE